MKEIWEKKPGRWKVSGETKVFPTKEEALAWASTLFEVVATPEPSDYETKAEDEAEDEAEDQVDPLEALKQARINRDGSIEEGLDYDGDYSE